MYVVKEIPPLSPPPSPADSSRAPLTRERIVGAAVALADAEGVDALSMRNLARRLGYEVMSLYNHVDNKDDLLALMVDAVADEIDRPDPDHEPLAAVRAITVSTHDVLSRHSWVTALWLRYVPGPARTRRMDDLLRLLADSGLSPELAHHGFHAVSNHVLGYTLQQVDMADAQEDPESSALEYMASIDDGSTPYMVAHVQQHLDGDTASSFELVLDLILDGLVRLDAEG